MSIPVSKLAKVQSWASPSGEMEQGSGAVMAKASPPSLMGGAPRTVFADNFDVVGDIFFTDFDVDVFRAVMGGDVVGAEFGECGAERGLFAGEMELNLFPVFAGFLPDGGLGFPGESVSGEIEAGGVSGAPAGSGGDVLEGDFAGIGEDVCGDEALMRALHLSGEFEFQ